MPPMPSSPSSMAPPWARFELLRAPRWRGAPLPGSAGRRAAHLPPANAFLERAALRFFFSCQAELTDGIRSLILPHKETRLAFWSAIAKRERRGDHIF